MKLISIEIIQNINNVIYHCDFATSLTWKPACLQKSSIVVIAILREFIFQCMRNIVCMLNILYVRCMFEIFILFISLFDLSLRESISATNKYKSAEIGQPCLILVPLVILHFWSLSLNTGLF